MIMCHPRETYEVDLSVRLTYWLAYCKATHLLPVSEKSVHCNKKANANVGIACLS